MATDISRELYKAAKKDEQNARRSELQKDRHAKRTATEFRKSLLDKVKRDLMMYMMVNPAWTPEDLLRNIHMFMKYYGITNRYLPPDFKEPQPEQQDGNDPGRIEASPDPAS